MITEYIERYREGEWADGDAVQRDGDKKRDRYQKSVVNSKNSREPKYDKFEAVKEARTADKLKLKNREKLMAAVGGEIRDKVGG